jgi:hypothetical protein
MTYFSTSENTGRTDLVCKNNLSERDKFTLALSNIPGAGCGRCGLGGDVSSGSTVRALVMPVIRLWKLCFILSVAFWFTEPSVLV